MTFANEHQDAWTLEEDAPGELTTRRSFLARSGLVAAAGVGAAAGAGLVPGVADATDGGGGPSLPTLARDAVVFGAPVVLMQRWFEAGKQSGMPINRFYVNTELSSPATDVVGPNDDTLYGLVWLDLETGPQVIEVPDTHGRYYSIQLIDWWSNSFSYIGFRATGTAAGAFAITPPGWSGSLPAGVKQIQATTKRVLGLVRTLVNDPADLPAAQEVQTSYTTGLLHAYPHGRLKAQVAANAEAFNIFAPINLSTAGLPLYEEINQGILNYPPLPADAAYATRLRPVGVDVAQYQQPSRGLGAVLEAAIAPAFTAAQAYLPKLATVEDTWAVVLGVTNITHNPLKRLGLVVYGPGTHIEKEALYFSALPVGGQPLDGTNTYTLTFAAGQAPPVRAFWSLIMYDTNQQLVANPINRYELASHNPTDLSYAPDGSLTLTISNTQPAGGTDNWLPAPAAPFRMILRTYVPEEPILDGSWTPPPLQLA